MSIEMLLNSGYGQMKIEVTVDDLKEFANELIEKAKSLRSPKGEVYLSRGEVISLLGVSPTTLWNWSKTGYLVPIKQGRKVVYRESDIKRLRGEIN